VLVREPALFHDGATEAVDNPLELALNFAPKQSMRECNFFAHFGCGESFPFARDLVNEFCSAHLVEGDLRFGQRKRHFGILAELALGQRAFDLAQKLFGSIPGDGKCSQIRLLRAAYISSPDVNIIRLPGIGHRDEV